MDTYYWYAVLPNIPIAPATEQPLGSITLEQIPFHDLSAIVAKIPEPHIDPTPQAIAEHHQVVAHLWDASNDRALPMRFGTVVFSRDRILSLLESRYDEWFSKLRDIAGCVEMALKVLWVPPTLDVPSRTVRSAYFTQRLRAMEQQKGLRMASEERIAAIDARLQELYVKRLTTTLRRPDLLIDGDYLIPRAKIPPFKQAIRTLMHEMKEYRWLCTGPWPPYHFVS